MFKSLHLLQVPAGKELFTAVCAGAGLGCLERCDEVCEARPCPDEHCQLHRQRLAGAHLRLHVNGKQDVRAHGLSCTLKE